MQKKHKKSLFGWVRFCMFQQSQMYLNIRVFRNMTFYSLRAHSVWTYCLHRHFFYPECQSDMFNQNIQQPNCKATQPRKRRHNNGCTGASNLTPYIYMASITNHDLPTLHFIISKSVGPTDQTRQWKVECSPYSNSTFCGSIYRIQHTSKTLNVLCLTKSFTCQQLQYGIHWCLQH